MSKRNLGIIQTLLTLLIGASVTRSVAQGTVFFSNFQVGGPNAPVYESDGMTKCSGSQFMAELLAGPTESTLVSIATTGFLTGNGAGYFNGNTQFINSVFPNATAWIQVHVWNTASGASFDQAKASGLPNSWWQSSVFSVITGGGAPNPSPPASLTDLGTSPVYLNGVPEPSVLALVGLGMVAVVLCHRNHPKSDIGLKFKKP